MANLIRDLGDGVTASTEIRVTVPVTVPVTVLSFCAPQMLKRTRRTSCQNFVKHCAFAIAVDNDLCAFDINT